MKQHVAESHSLGRIIPWGHGLLAEVVRPGSLVVDLTAGRGQDTLALWQMVGEQGQVIALDIQAVAIAEARRRLVAAGVSVRLSAEESLPLSRRPGVDLVEICHSRYTQVISQSPTAVIANLGYLPGGDQSLITLPETTLAALRQALESLVSGGRMAVVVYPGHPGGEQEAVAVRRFFSTLDNGFYEVLYLSLCNRHQAPSLFVAEKRVGAERGS